MAKGDKITVAVLSGKGGTGKTLVSVNLAAVAKKSVYVDCDVEEPNGHLFLQPAINYTEQVTVKIPVINAAKCNGCRKCVDFCKFNALALIEKLPHVFTEVCHSCGGCMLLCPEKAISEQEKPIGTIQQGVSGDVFTSTGILNIGAASGIPIIKRLLQLNAAAQEHPVFIDCPPGSACIVMESIKDADYCLMIAEPTLFGVHNLSMIYILVSLFNKPHGVILNKCLTGKNPVEDFCEKHSIPILFRIPFDHELGALNSAGKVAARESGEYKQLFTAMYETVMREVQCATITHS